MTIDNSPVTLDPVPLALFEQDFSAFSKALGRSFERYGFAVISGLFEPGRAALDQALVDRAYGATRAFFALSDEQKKHYHIAGGGGARGYTPFGIETAKGFKAHDLKEFWHMGRDLPNDHPYRDHMADNIWPTEIVDFQPAISQLFDVLDGLGKKVLSAIALYLDMDPTFFDDKVRLGNSVLRLLHYPPVHEPGEHVRAGAHGDINAITLLMGAEEPGLQILDRNGEWLPITPMPGSIVINIGDMLSRLTNHILPSTVHRVINPDDERKAFARYSMPFFLHFESPYLIETLTQCISDDHPDQYAQSSITAHDFLLQRLKEIKLT